MIEYEGKILDVDPDAIHNRILDTGGRFLGEALQRRLVFDVTPGDVSRWIRHRDNGTTVTLATKHIHHDGLDGTEEHEVTVSDFDETHRLLQAMGFTAKSSQESRRSSYSLHGADVSVDQWPLIAAYAEVEGTSREHVVEVAALLGFAEDHLTGVNTTAVYRQRGIDLTVIPDLRF